MMIEDINISKDVPKQVLLDTLKFEAKTITITDIMAASIHIKNESMELPASYRAEYHNAYIQSFTMRITKMKNNKKYYDGFVSADKLQEIIKILKEQEKLVEPDDNLHIQFFKIYRLIAIYTTFIMNESVHPVGLPFPSGFKIKQENGIYYCPVKEIQKDNRGAVCRICISEQDQDI